MDMYIDKMFEYFVEQKCVIGASVTTALGLLLLKQYLAGGVCRSQARLNGKTVIITGSNTGIGKETARDLAKRGARMIMACRDMTKAELTAEELRSDTKNKNIVVRKLDLASLKSVRRFAEEILKMESKIDILINNAGVMYCPYSKTVEGFEMQFGTNHLGPFLLTNILLDRIKESAPARIINVASLAHAYAKPLDLDNMNCEKGYDLYEAYHRSKLLNVLFTRELSNRLKVINEVLILVEMRKFYRWRRHSFGRVIFRGTGVTVNSLHPGIVDTDLPRHFSMFSRIMTRPIMWLIKDARAGAQTSIYCAVAEELDGVSGKHFSDCAVTEEAKQAQDDHLAKQVWEISEKMIARAK